jgi:Ankyrin repeats (3 copies)
MPVLSRSNSSTLFNEGRAATAASSAADSPTNENEVSCCCSPSPNAAAADEDDEEQTVMTAVSSCSSLLSFASSSSSTTTTTTRDESEQTLRKRPSFQSLEDAALLLSGGGVDSTSSSENGTLAPLTPSVAAMEEQGQQVAQQPLKKVRSASSLQDLITIPKPFMLKEKEAELLLPDYKTVGVDPDAYLVQLIQAMHPDGVRVQPKEALELDNDFFPSITEPQMAAYTMEVVTATRQNQVETLREIVAKQGPHAVDCFNRFGESLLNLSCRRGFTDIVSFLVHDVGLTVRTCDDGGRTLMHDACWHAGPPLLDICTWLVEKDPSLLLIQDKRGYTAFQYARKSDWYIWRKFLFDNRHGLIQGLVLREPHLISIFASASQ